MSDKKTDGELLASGAQLGARLRPSKSNDANGNGRTAAASGKDTDSGTDEKKLRELSTREAYFVALNDWVKHANISQNAMALFPWYLVSSYPQMFQNQNQVNEGFSGVSSSAYNPLWSGAPPTVPNSQQTTQQRQQNRNRLPPEVAEIGVLRVLDEQAQMDLINRHGGQEYVIAPFWKRIVAEIIDVVIMLLIKIMITFTIMSLFDLDMGFDLDQQDHLRKAIDDEGYTGFLAASMEFLAFSSELLILEFLTKLVVCVCEAVFTTVFNGATPGKAVMNLRIYYVEAVILLQQVQPQVAEPLRFQFPFHQTPARAMIYPGHTPSFMRAFMRAICKNLLMTLLFPVMFIMVFVRNNRTVYDVITKTIVVEGNRNRV